MPVKFELLIAMGLGLVLVGCTAPRFDYTTAEGRAAIIDETHRRLTNNDCAGAIALIEGLYQSVWVDNDVRMARAAAHGCNAGVNFFQMVWDLAHANLNGKEFWKTTSSLFYATDPDLLDKRWTSGWFASDALMATLNPGSVVVDVNQVNPATGNVGSTLASDRTLDSNAYLIFVSIATLGALQNRYSAPDTSTWVKTQVLGFSAANPNGWEKAVDTNIVGDESGCAFSASTLNLIDAIDLVAPGVNGALSITLEALRADFADALSQACDAGCRGDPAATINGQVIDFSGTGCAFTDTFCAGTNKHPCMLTMRNRAACTGATTDRASCAAAGIARLIDQHTTLGWNP